MIDRDDGKLVTPEQIQRYADRQALNSLSKVDPEQLRRDLLFARGLQKAERQLAEIEKESEPLLAKLRKFAADVPLLKARSEALRKSMDATLAQRKKRQFEKRARQRSLALRDSLRRAAEFRKSNSWAKLPRANRLAIERAERDCEAELERIKTELARLVSDHQARRAAADAARKHHAAMVERGVTFHRMGHP